MTRLLGRLWWLLAASATIAFLSPPFLWLAGVMDGGGLTQYMRQVVSGVANGCVYALVALGIVLIYKATETINFAQGELMMVGAFLAFTFITMYGVGCSASSMKCDSARCASARVTGQSKLSSVPK